MSNLKPSPQEAQTDITKNVDDVNYVLQMTRWTLKPLGQWPVTSSTYPVYLRWFAICICTFLLFFRLVPSMLFMYFINGNFKWKIKLLGPISNSMMSICKYFKIISKRREINEFLNRITKDWGEIVTEEERNIMIDSTKTARSLTTVCAIFVYSGGMLNNVVVPILRGKIVIGNVTYRHLAYPSYFIFFDPRVRPAYDVIYTTQIMCSAVTYGVAVSVCGLAILCVLHICGQITIISKMLQQLAEHFDRELLGRIVVKHINSLEFAKKLENILNEICIVEMLGCTFNICMLGYYLINEFSDSENIMILVYSILLVSFTFNIFILCYIGDFLTSQCCKLGDNLYMTNWHKLSGKNARNLILIKLASLRPVTITAGKMVALSLKSFTSVMKLSFSYMNMLLTLIANSNIDIQK